MAEEEVSTNGLMRNNCNAHVHTSTLEHILNESKLIRLHMEQQVKQNRMAYEWLVSYIERTMPIKSHYWILLGSLSILAAFAAVIKYIDYTMK